MSPSATAEWGSCRSGLKTETLSSVHSHDESFFSPTESLDSSGVRGQPYLHTGQGCCQLISGDPFGCCH